MLFFGHNVETRKLKKLIKGSKDLDYYLVSNINLSQKIPYSSWCPRPGNLSQNGIKPTPLMASPMKNKIQSFPIFFSMQTRRLAASFTVLILTAL